jgi:hypothetical protein
MVIAKKHQISPLMHWQHSKMTSMMIEKKTTTTFTKLMINRENPEMRIISNLLAMTLLQMHNKNSIAKLNL